MTEIDSDGDRKRQRRIDASEIVSTGPTRRWQEFERFDERLAGRQVVTDRIEHLDALLPDDAHDHDRSCERDDVERQSGL